MKASRLRSVSAFGHIALPVVIALVIQTDSEVSAQREPSLLRGQSVVQLPKSSFELRPETAQREVLQGESVNGDCRFSISFHADAKSAAPQMAAMVAVDPATCRAEIERGVPMVVPTDDGVRRVELDLSARAGQVEAQGANRDRKATFWTIWEAPPKAAVAKVRTSVRSVVKNRKIERALCSVNIDPLHQTGWQIDRSYFDHDCN
jgi:hypothetical protein